MKLVTLRKNKNYTSILINEISLEALRQAVEEYEKLTEKKEYKVIKPTQKSIKKLINEYPLTWEEVAQQGIKEIEFFGIHFSLSTNLKKYSLEGCKCAVSYQSRVYKTKETFGIIQGRYVADSLLETYFHEITDILLYF